VDPHFNLIDEPFIPCVAVDGRSCELGLRETLARAHELREISAGSPLVECALHLLLLAVVHRTYGPPDARTWAAIWQSDRFDPGPLGEYLERWRERFDLFDKERPFYQVAEFETNSPAPLIKLDMVPDNDPILFYHRTADELPEMSFAEAARLLIAFQFFAIGFGRSATGQRKDGPGTRGFTVLAEGDNLFQTMMLNATAYPAEIIGIRSNSADTPEWEREEPRRPGTTTLPEGYLDYLTWQSRAIRLLPEDGRVRRAHIAQGVELGGSVRHPHSCYITTREGQKSLGFSENRTLWRDSTALIKIRAEDVEQPLCVRWAGRLVEDDLLPADRVFGFRIYGIATEPGKAAKVILWRAEKLPFPLVYLRSPELVAYLQRAVASAEDAHRALQKGVCVLGRHSLYPNKPQEEPSPKEKRDIKDLIASLDADAVYWPALESPYRRLMVRMGRAQANVDSAVLDWFRLVVRSARDAFRRAEEKLAPSARNLRAATHGRRAFEDALRKAVPALFDEEVKVG